MRHTLHLSRLKVMIADIPKDDGVMLYFFIYPAHSLKHLTSFNSRFNNICKCIFIDV